MEGGAAALCRRGEGEAVTSRERDLCDALTLFSAQWFGLRQAWIMRMIGLKLAVRLREHYLVN